MYTDPSGYAIQDFYLGWLYADFAGGMSEANNHGPDYTPYFSFGNLFGRSIAFHRGMEGMYFSWAKLFYSGVTNTRFWDFLFSGGKYSLDGKNVLHGKDATIWLYRKFCLSVKSNQSATTDGTSLNPSNETLKEFAEKYFKKFKYLANAKLIYEKGHVEEIDEEWGAYTSKKPVDDIYSIYFAEKAFSSKWTLYLYMGHEFVHVANFVNGYTDNSYSEYAAYIWDYRVSQNPIFWDQAEAEFSSIRFVKSIAIKYMQYGTWGLCTTIPKGLIY